MLGFFSTDHGKISFMASVNLSLAGFHAWVIEAEPYLSFFLMLVQIGVGVVTIIYTVKKVRQRK